MKLFPPFSAIALVLLQLCTSGAARAQVTFEDIAPTDYLSSPITSQQFTFSTAGIHLVGNTTTLAASPIAGDGNFLVYNSTIGYGASFASTTGAAFNLLSLDLGGWYNFGPSAQAVTINGLRAGSTVASVHVNVMPGAFTHFALSGFSNLNTVHLVHAGGATSYYVGIDNIVTSAVLTPVPEPETYAMLLAGLGLLGFIARRRKQA